MCKPIAVVVLICIGGISVASAGDDHGILHFKNLHNTEMVGNIYSTVESGRNSDVRPLENYYKNNSHDITIMGRYAQNQKDIQRKLRDLANTNVSTENTRMYSVTLDNNASPKFTSDYQNKGTYIHSIPVPEDVRYSVSDSPNQFVRAVRRRLPIGALTGGSLLIWDTLRKVSESDDYYANSVLSRAVK